MADSLIRHANGSWGLLLFYLLVALPPLLAWWICRFPIWIGLKILVAALAIPRTGLFLFWLLYFSVAALLMTPVVVPIVWIVFGVIIWGAVRLLGRYPSRPNEA